MANITINLAQGDSYDFMYKIEQIILNRAKHRKFQFVVNEYMSFLNREWEEYEEGTPEDKMINKVMDEFRKLITENGILDDDY